MIRTGGRAVWIVIEENRLPASQSHHRYHIRDRVRRHQHPASGVADNETCQKVDSTPGTADRYRERVGSEPPGDLDSKTPLIPNRAHTESSQVGQRHDPLLWNGGRKPAGRFMVIDIWHRIRKTATDQSTLTTAGLG